MLVAYVTVSFEWTGPKPKLEVAASAGCTTGHKQARSGLEWMVSETCGRLRLGERNLEVAQKRTIRYELPTVGLVVVCCAERQVQVRG